MKPTHYFIANYKPEYNEYKFDKILPCNAAPEIGTINGVYYRHRFDYPDAVFYVYCSQTLTGAAEQKLYSDLLVYAPQG